MVSTSRVLTGGITALAFSLLAAGCSEPADTAAPVASPAVVVTPAVAKTPEKLPAVEPSQQIQSQPAPENGAKPAEGAATPDLATTPTPANDAPEKPTVAEYKPPFPDRTDLFVPPKRQGGVRLTDGGTEDSVELLGFVTVDRPQVVLSVNGQVAPIAVGASQFGIEVISIHPPKVVLQRGRQRWQASLEN